MIKYIIICTFYLLPVLCLSQSNLSELEKKQLINDLKKGCSKQNLEHCTLLGIISDDNTLLQQTCKKGSKEACYQLEDRQFEKTKNELIFKNIQRHCLDGYVSSCAYFRGNTLTDETVGQILKKFKLEELSILTLSKLAIWNEKKGNKEELKNIYKIMCFKDSRACKEYIIETLGLNYKNTKSLKKKCNDGDRHVCAFLSFNLKGKKTEESFLLSKKACALNNFSSCTLVGYRLFEKIEKYITGEFKESEFNKKISQEAFEFFEKGCKGGESLSCEGIDKMFTDNHIRDLKKREKWLRMGCHESNNNYNNAIMCSTLGQLYENEALVDILTDEEKYFKSTEDSELKQKIISSYQKGCIGNDTFSCQRLAEILEVKGLSKSEIITHYKRSCDFGNAKGCHRLAELNPNDSLFYLRLACHFSQNEKGENTSCRDLATKEALRGSNFVAERVFSYACFNGDWLSCLANAGRMYTSGRADEGRISFLKATEFNDWDSKKIELFYKKIKSTKFNFSDLKDEANKLCTGKFQENKTCLLARINTI